jgi:two-component system, cell cycle sensor histidine kinase and response regulator CckA
VSELEDLRREIVFLRQSNDRLLRQASGGGRASEAFAVRQAGAANLENPASPDVLFAGRQGLDRNEQLLRAIFHDTLDAILLTSDDGRHVDANPAACALFGLSREQLIGRSIAELAARGQDLEPAYWIFRQRGQMRGQFPLHRLDGSRRVLDYSSVAHVAPGLHLSVMRDITDKIAAEEALRRSEAHFRAVIEKSAEVISLTAADGTTRYLTPSAWRLLGWTPEEMGTRTLREQVVPEDRVRIASELERLVRTGDRDMSMEFRVRHRDGSIRWIESTGTNLLDDPDVGAIVGNYRDISARKQAEEALRESSNLLEEAQAIALVGSWTSGIGPDAQIGWSRESYRIFGVREGTPVTVPLFLSLVHSADRERVMTASREATEKGARYDIEHRVRRPDGQVRWVHERAVVERDAAATPIRLIGTVQDISQRRLAVEALQASEERYRRIVENTSEGVWTYDVQGITTFMNARMAAMLGYTVEEALGQPIYTFMDEVNYAAAKARIERRRLGIGERGDFPLRHKDGTELWVSIQANPLFDREGRFEGSLSLVTDVSAQRRADEARARLAAIIESSEDAILSSTLDGTITSWNLGAEKLYQYSATEIVGRSIFLLISPALVDGERQMLERVAGGEAVRQHESERLRKDGSVVAVAVTISPIRDATGTVIGVSKIVRDLTERRKTEAALHRTETQFRQAQKMEAVGRLAGGVAHDFNNLLSVVLSYAEIGLEDLKSGDPLRDCLKEIQTAGQRATELTRQLLAFSRQQVLQPRVVDLNQVVAGMKAMLGRLLGEDVELTAIAAPSIGRVLADPGQIEQVVMNLAVNARDAMPEGGKLTVETANITFAGSQASAPIGVPPGAYVMLAISDTGIGMDAATRARLFEPFFTTKEQGKGTGLGLATVFGIVKQSGGHVSVYSEPGHGSAFKIYLPRTDRAADPSTATLPAAALRGSETILLVEDEAQVRAVACTILRRHGYNVVESSNGHEASMLSRDFPARIHLLLTDVVMPRMSGRKLAEQLVPQRPEMKVLFASGYTDDAIVHHGVLEAGVAFLQKPFTPDALLRKVREVLDAPGPILVAGAGSGAVGLDRP